MKWLNIDKIKAQCRIEQDFTDEDTLLEMYGESAEETVLNTLSRSYEDMMETYGKLPTPIMLASLMLVDVWYQHRSPVDGLNMSVVPYTFEILLKPYMRLASASYEQTNNQGYGCKNL